MLPAEPGGNHRVSKGHFALFYRVLQIVSLFECSVSL